MANRIKVDGACFSTTAEAARVMLVNEDGSTSPSSTNQVSMEVHVLFPLVDDATPVLLLDSDPTRIRVVFQTDATFLCIAESAAKCNISNCYLTTFGYSALEPVELHTTGQIWVANFAVSPSGAQNAVRCMIERRV